MIDRTELAARIFAVSCYKGGYPCANSFAQADKFLAYAAKEREKGKPKYECEHDWDCSAAKPYWHCAVCGELKYKDSAPKVKPEPPKHERVAAREFSLYKFADGEIRAFPSDQATVVYAGFTAPIFICATREILPGDEHDK